MRLLPHPERDSIALPTVLDALSDPARLAIVAQLAAVGETPCGGFTGLGSKPNLTYHLGRLREAGVTMTRVVGTSRLISLRRGDLDQRFPGLLDAVLAACPAPSDPEAAVAQRGADRHDSAVSAGSRAP